MIFRRNKLLTVLLAIGVIGAAWALSLRHQAEMGNRAVEIAVDYAEVAKLSSAAGVTVTEALSKLKDAGVTSLSVQQPTISDLAAVGQISFTKADIPFSGTILNVQSQDALLSIFESEIFMKKAVPVGEANPNVNTQGVFFIKAEPEYVLAIPVGLPKAALDAARKSGLYVVARLVNYPGVRPEDIEKTALNIKKEGVRTVIFAGDEVLGFRGTIDEASEALKKHGLIFGSVEFAKQKGDQRLSEKMLPDIVRVHSITAAEMGSMDRTTAVERFVRAANERNIRLLYVRMFDFGTSDLLETNIDYIRAISNGLKAEGLGVKQARPFADPGVPMPAMLMIAIGIAAGVVLLFSAVARFSSKAIWPVYALVALILAGLVLSGMTLGLKLAALITAIVFPIFAIFSAAYGTPENPDGLPIRAQMWKAAGRFFGVIAVSVSGGLMIAALLARQEFMLRVDQFAGVKLAHILPIMIAAIALAVGLGWGAASWREQVERVNTNIRKLGTQPILIWHSALAMIMLVMLGLLLARSGNEPGVGVSGLELKFRSLLDIILFVRPRTKEFLIGHPALFLGIAAALGGRRSWATLLLAIGIIGEVSVVNTFCHIHTPIATSVLRVAIGSVLGLALGMLLLLSFSRFNRIRPEYSGKDVEREQVGVQK